MFNYIKIPYSQKIEQLLKFHGSQARLSDHLEVSRQSILNWRENDTSLKEDNKIKIDVAYCKAFGFDAIDINEISKVMSDLNKIDFSYFNISEDSILNTISRFSSFGSLEIEDSNITLKKFNKVVIENEIIPDLNLREIYAINNLSSLSSKIIKDTLNEPTKIFPITTDKIKNWHFVLMNGIRTDAGEYSKKYRIIPGSEDLHLTDPRDIPEEMEFWCNKYEDIKSIEDIAKAHSHFEAIHPFGDGNGRLGRIIMYSQCIKAGFIPPLINKENKALYLVFLKHAQVNSEYGHLTYFLASSILNMHKKVFKY
ncbi:Fic family protein [Aliarcobacter butzleri]